MRSKFVILLLFFTLKNKIYKVDGVCRVVADLPANTVKIRQKKSFPFLEANFIVKS